MWERHARMVLGVAVIEEEDRGMGEKKPGGRRLAGAIKSINRPFYLPTWEIDILIAAMSSSKEP